MMAIVSVTVFIAMFGGHWFPALDGEGRTLTLWRYVWGVGWIDAAVVAYYLVAHPTATMVVWALLAVTVAAGLGTCAGHLYDVAVQTWIRARRNG